MDWNDAGLVVLSAAMVATVAAAASRVSTRLSAGVVTVLGLWLAATAGLARSGVLARWDARPPRLVLLPLVALGTGLLVRRTATFRAVLGRVPRAWVVGAQAYRVGVELALYGLHASGRAPVQVTFEGRNVDVLVGLTAPLVAWAVARGRATPALVVVWNALGLGVLLNTVFTVVTSTPGPLHLPWPGAPLTELSRWPAVWLPAFLAPLAVFLHVASLQQNVPLLRRRAVAGVRS